MLGSDKMTSKYICCFCGDTIKSNELDITGLVIVSNWDKAPDRQQEQQLFCHMNCLKESLDTKVPLYIADIID